GGAPERGDVDVRAEPEPVERGGDRLPRDPVQDEGDGVDGAGDQVDAGACGRDRAGKHAAARALAVEPDRQPAGLSDRPAELADPVRLERSGRVVDQDPGRAELDQTARLGDERVGLPGRAGAVDEAGVELTAGRGDRLARLT